VARFLGVVGCRISPTVFQLVISPITNKKLHHWTLLELIILTFEISFGAGHVQRRTAVVVCTININFAHLDKAR
jgi:hypothetical protein